MEERSLEEEQVRESLSLPLPLSLSLPLPLFLSLCLPLAPSGKSREQSLARGANTDGWKWSREASRVKE